MKGFQARIHKKVVRGCVYYCIIVPADLTASRRRAWEYFKTRQAAMARAAQLNGALLSRKRAAVLTEQEEADAVRAFELLRDLGLPGVSLRQAVEAAVPSLKRGGGVQSLSKLFKEFAEAKDPIWSALSKRNFSNMSKPMLSEFGADTPADSISAQSLTRFLIARFKTDGYRAFAIRALSPAFTWGVKMGMVQQNPFLLVEKPRVKRGRIRILTVPQARHALRVCPPDCIAAVALMLFGGIRPQEVQRMQWSDVLDDIVHLTPDITKTAQVRNVRINEALRAWLDVCGGPRVGSITPQNWIRKYSAWRADAKLTGMQDVLRHTFATYHLRHWMDENALKSEMGHSRNSETLFAHYLAAATPAEAAKFWALRPELDA